MLYMEGDSNSRSSYSAELKILCHCFFLRCGVARGASLIRAINTFNLHSDYYSFNATALGAVPFELTSMSAWTVEKMILQNSRALSNINIRWGLINFLTFRKTFILPCSSLRHWDSSHEAHFVVIFIVNICLLFMDIDAYAPWKSLNMWSTLNPTLPGIASEFTQFLFSFPDVVPSVFVRMLQY